MNVPQTDLLKLNKLSDPAKKQTIINNFNFCVPQYLPYSYPFYRCQPQFPCYRDAQFPVSMANSPPDEDQKEPPYTFPTQKLPLLPYSQPITDTPCKARNIVDLFNIQVDQEYYGELYGNQN